MDRRRFLAASSLLVASPAWAGMMCTPAPVADASLCRAELRRDLAAVPASSSDAAHLTRWCWAACVETVFRYHGFLVPQARIVAETFGAIADWPPAPEAVLAYLERSWKDDNGRPFRTEGLVYDADVEAAATDLGADVPLILGTDRRPVVLTALHYLRGKSGSTMERASAVDPAPGAGTRALDAVEWNTVRYIARLRLFG